MIEQISTETSRLQILTVNVTCLYYVIGIVIDLSKHLKIIF